MRLTKNDIVSTYEKIKRTANKYINEANLDLAIKEIENSATIAYMFNFFYADIEVEKMIRKISCSIIKEKHPICNDNDKIVFYDAFGYDNRGLTQQYIRALNKLGVNYLFIYEKKNPSFSKEIDYDLKSGGNQVEIYELDSNLEPVAKIKELYRVINQYAPSKALLHIAPWSVVALSVFYAFPDIKKFNINLTDHAFWLGSECIDYNIEFRDYGYSVSMQMRHLKEEQLLYLPYYPIINTITFQGLPIEISKEHVVILSGGALYKIYGENGIYFDIVDKILKENSNVILLYAGDGDRTIINKFIKQKKLENRFFLLGHRADINELYKACDMYLCTYPLAGGLMAQYAAINSKPILAYSSGDYPTNFIEGLICHNKNITITHTDLNSFFDFCKKLCVNKDIRHEEGQNLKDCLFTEAQFINGLANILNGKISKKNEEISNINYNKLSNLYLEVENKFQLSFKKFILSKYKLKAFIYFPVVSFKIFCSIFFKLVKYSLKK